MEINILDRVSVKALDVSGTVLSIHHQIGKTEYQVRYFMNGEPQTIYYHDFEIEKIDE